MVSVTSKSETQSVSDDVGCVVVVDDDFVVSGIELLSEKDADIDAVEFVEG